MKRLAVVALWLTVGCEAKVDPAIDVCQVNIDCTLVQLDACCERSTCEADLSAETSARTRLRLSACKKDCPRQSCTPSGPRVGAFCRDGRCVLEAGRR